MRDVFLLLFAVLLYFWWMQIFIFLRSRNFLAKRVLVWWTESLKLVGKLPWSCLISFVANLDNFMFYEGFNFNKIKFFFFSRASISALKFNPIIISHNNLTVKSENWYLFHLDISNSFNLISFLWQFDIGRFFWHFDFTLITHFLVEN